MNSIVERTRCSYALTLFFCIVCLIAAVWILPLRRIDVFIKLGDVCVYRISFYLLVTFSLLIMKKIFLSGGILKAIFLGCVVGYISSILAIFIMTLALPDFSERTWPAFHLVMLVYGYWAFVFRGWLFGGLLGLLLKFIYIDTSAE